MPRCKNKGEKVDSEIEMIGLMTKIYCRGNKHGNHDELCPDCQELVDYAIKRIEFCPRMEEKTFCSTCPVHCYNKTMREKIRQVMRYSGPRMLFYRPIPAIKHCINTVKAKRAKSKKTA